MQREGLASYTFEIDMLAEFLQGAVMPCPELHPNL